MSRPHILSVSTLAVAVLAAGLVGSPAHAAPDPACQPVYAAMIKMATTPNHMFLTEKAATDPAPESSEVITTGSTMYLKVAGKWNATPYNSQQQISELRQAAAAGKQTCQHVRDEVVAGEPTTLYNTQEKEEDGTTVNSQLWISRTRNLPVKQTIDMDVGGKLGKSHTDGRIDYTNVQAPAGGK